MPRLNAKCIESEKYVIFGSTTGLEWFKSID